MKHGTEIHSVDTGLPERCLRVSEPKFRLHHLVAIGFHPVTGYSGCESEEPEQSRAEQSRARAEGGEETSAFRFCLP